MPRKGGHQAISARLGLKFAVAHRLLRVVPEVSRSRIKLLGFCVVIELSIFEKTLIKNHDFASQIERHTTNGVSTSYTEPALGKVAKVTVRG